MALKFELAEKAVEDSTAIILKIEKAKIQTN